MSSATSIVIVRPEHVVSVRKRLAEAAVVSVIAESELLSMQEVILERPPELVVMHASFAATSRGATLVAALKARPRETGTAIRVFLEDEVKAPVLLSESAGAGHDALLESSRPLDRAGTRQAARYPMRRRPVMVNGDDGELIDLSVSGAQLQTAIRLRPLKIARLVLSDGGSELRLQGTVVWAVAVPSGGAIHYRAGVEFVNPDQAQLAAFCARHGGAPDLTMSATGR